MSGKIFKEYYARVAKEGVLKAVFCGLIVGFSVTLLAATTFWLLGERMWIWLSLLFCPIVAGITTPIFYQTKFKPNTKKLARRIDELGLEERILTMAQLQGDESYIAMKQREDAMKAIQRVNPKLVKFAISVPLVIALGVVATVSTSVTTVFALGEKTGKEYIEEAKAANIPEYEITYEIDGEGEIVGEPFQIVKEGESGTPIEAVPAPNWAFDCWLELEADDEGKVDPCRTETEVKGHIVLTAVFIEIPDLPEEEQSSNQQGDEVDASKKKPSSEEEQSQPGQSNQTGEGGGAGGSIIPSDLIIDGETVYGDEIDATQGEAEGDLSQDDGMSDEVGDIIGDYYGSIQN
ncbi:MAG: hypothetical protein IKA88_04075 [Clostridia bacterium]|nr:hypothetical protein [Clostridia bacterium]